MKMTSPRVIYSNHSTSVTVYNYESIFRYCVNFIICLISRSNRHIPPIQSVLNAGFLAATPISSAEKVVIGTRSINSLMLKDASDLSPQNFMRNASRSSNRRGDPVGIGAPFGTSDRICGTNQVSDRSQVSHIFERLSHHVEN